MARHWQYLYTQTAAGSITGSIERICAGSDTAVVITSHTTGEFKGLTYTDGTTADITGSQHEQTTSTTDNLNLASAKNQCIDGPFIAVHGDGNTVLVYHNGLANIVDD